MAEYDASTYGEQIADIFDDLYGNIENVDAMAEFLAAPAQSGRALELGIGTGRVALPLAARGIEVHGIDASPAMVAKMRSKPGGRRYRLPSVISPGFQSKANSVSSMSSSTPSSRCSRRTSRSAASSGWRTR